MAQILEAPTDSERLRESMKAAPGHGKWRVKGRGRRLPCDIQVTKSVRGRTHSYMWPCRWCGVQLYAEIGKIERMRFLVGL